MSRLNEAISDVAYILDVLRAYKNIVETGNCNICGRKNTCQYCPSPEQLVRYNCPHYQTGYRKMTSEQAMDVVKEWTGMIGNPDIFVPEWKKEGRSRSG